MENQELENQELENQETMKQEVVNEAAPAETPKKKKGKLIGIIVAVVVLLLAAFGVFAWKTGLFLKPADKVLVAMKNTFSQKDTLLTSLQNGFEEREAVTLKLTGDYEDFSGECSLMTNSTGVGVDAKMNIPSMPAMSAKMVLNQEAPKIQLPELCDQLFVYDYHNINENCIFLQFMQKEDLERINDSLQQTVDSCARITKQEELYKQLGEDLLAWFRELPFDSAETKEWTVNGEFVKCKGYTAHLEVEQLQSFWDIMKNYLVQLNPEKMEQDLHIDLTEAKKMDVSFYLYKNNLAAIQCVEEDGKQAAVLTLEGGETPWQNMAICDDKREILRMRGNTTDGVETLAFSTDNTDIFSFVYMAADGNYNFTIFGNGESAMEMGGVIVSGPEEVSMTFDKIKLNGEDKDASFGFVMTKGATMPVLEGEAFDVNGADMNAWTGLLMGIAGSEAGSAVLSGMF